MLRSPWLPEPPPATPTQPAPAPISSRNLWDLDADPGALRQAAQGWSSLGEAQRAGAESVITAAAPVLGEWVGDAAESYRRHKARITSDLEAAGALADRVAGAMGDATGSLTSAQVKLSTNLAGVRAKLPVDISGDQVTFRPQDAGDVAVVTQAIAQAVAIRADLDHQLLAAVSTLSSLAPQFVALASKWASVAAGSSDPFTMPPEAPGPGTIYDFANNQFIINSGTGNDNIELRVDPATGERTVVINGVSHSVPDGMAITIRAGEGDDTISVPAGTRVNLVLLGGTGNDRVSGGGGNDRILAGDGEDIVAGNGGADGISAGSGNDTVTGGDGNDTIAGNAGNDNIDTGEGNDRASGGDGLDYLYGYRGNDSLHGGEGDDVVYGGGDNDTVTGGSGRDFVDGGRGDDTAEGGSGDDIVSGGRGNDQVLGGSGDDTLVAGDGRDTVEGGTGTDKAYTQGEDSTSAENVVTVVVMNDAGHSIIIDGPPEFQERVRDDLDLMQALPDGQKMLLSLDIANDLSRVFGSDGNTLTIKFTPDLNGYAMKNGDDYEIQYNPRLYGFGEGSRPITVLYHEFAHVYDYSHDTLAPGQYNHPGAEDDGVNNRERAAVGLPITDDPFWPWEHGREHLQENHPPEYTENGMREALGLPPREHYRDGPVRADPPKP